MRVSACFILATAAVALTGCGVSSVGNPEARVGDLVSDPVHVDSADVSSAVIKLKMGVGDLEVSGGDTAGLVDGKLEYNVPSWKPNVEQKKEGHTVHVSVEQPSSAKSSGGDAKNRWTLQVANNTPVSFEVECGVGKATLNLGAMKLRDVTLNVGVGKIEVDLRGKPDHDYSVKVHGGVGQATIYVPADASVSAKVQSGLAPVKVEGLEKHGETWESADFGKAKPTIQLEVEGGIGQIRVVREAAN